MAQGSSSGEHAEWVGMSHPRGVRFKLAEESGLEAENVVIVKTEDQVPEKAE